MNDADYSDYIDEQFSLDEQMQIDDERQYFDLLTDEFGLPFGSEI
ncbi:hypothetical protein ACFBZI_08425 [Moraxella sp. ZJ142]